MLQIFKIKVPLQLFKNVKLFSLSGMVQITVHQMLRVLHYYLASNKEFGPKACYIPNYTQVGFTSVADLLPYYTVRLAGLG